MLFARGSIERKKNVGMLQLQHGSCVLNLTTDFADYADTDKTEKKSVQSV
jgi:hypothetical protein